MALSNLINQHMKKAHLPILMLAILSALSITEAQAPTPPSVPTLGPVIICSVGDSATNVKILSPQNHQNFSNNKLQVNFTVQALGMFAQFGNIGYSLDGGTVNSVNKFVNKTVDHPADAPDWYWDRTTVFATLVLSDLSEMEHNITVYYGWQYLGTNNPDLERFEVYAYASVNFTVTKTTDASSNPSPNPSATPSPTQSIDPTPTVAVDNSPNPNTSPPPPIPSPTIPELPSLTITLLAIALILWTTFYRKKIKKADSISKFFSVHLLNTYPVLP
jgi:hypothetical protein